MRAGVVARAAASRPPSAHWQRRGKVRHRPFPSAPAGTHEDEAIESEETKKVAAAPLVAGAVIAAAGRNATTTVFTPAVAASSLMPTLMFAYIHYRFRPVRMPIAFGWRAAALAALSAGCCFHAGDFVVALFSFILNLARIGRPCCWQEAVLLAVGLGSALCVFLAASSAAGSATSEFLASVILLLGIGSVGASVAISLQAHRLRRTAAAVWAAATVLGLSLIVCFCGLASAVSSIVVSLLSAAMPTGDVVAALFYPRSPFHHRAVGAVGLSLAFGTAILAAGAVTWLTYHFVPNLMAATVVGAITQAIAVFLL